MRTQFGRKLPGLDESPARAWRGTGTGPLQECEQVWDRPVNHGRARER